jgi:hypothetical protein
VESLCLQPWPVWACDAEKRSDCTLKTLTLMLAGFVSAVASGMAKRYHPRLQTNGVPGDLVKEWVGHSNLRTPSGYTHFRDDFRTPIAGEVGAFCKDLRGGKIAR